MILKPKCCTQRAIADLNFATIFRAVTRQMGHFFIRKNPNCSKWRYTWERVVGFYYVNQETTEHTLIDVEMKNAHIYPPTLPFFTMKWTDRYCETILKWSKLFKKHTDTANSTNIIYKCNLRRTNVIPFQPPDEHYPRDKESWIDTASHSSTFSIQATPGWTFDSVAEYAFKRWRERHHLSRIHACEYFRSATLLCANCVEAPHFDSETRILELYHDSNAH